MTNSGKSNGDAGQDGYLNELHEDVVHRLEIVLGAVANRFFAPKLEDLREDIQKEIAGCANSLKKRLDAANEEMGNFRTLQETEFQEMNQQIGGLMTRCDGAQSSIDHLSAEVSRLETLLQQQASVAADAELRLTQLNARMIWVRRVLWLFAAALVTSFFLMLKHP